MASLRQMLPAARVELLEPRQQKPSYRHLLHIAVAVVQNALNEANNTHRAWAVDDTVLSVVAGVDEYTLNVANVGKVLDVTASDPLNVEGTERQIPFSDFADMAGDLRGVGEYGGAARIAFYRRGGSDVLYAKVRPIPTQSQDYTVSFNVGSWADGAALDDEPFLKAHHHYFVASIARDSLPAAEWFDDEAKNNGRRNNLELALSRRVEQYHAQFRLSIAALTVPRNTYRMEAFPIE
jgi:hypothetical protein